MRKLKYIAFLFVLISCNATKSTSVMMNDQAPVIVYKTKADYYDKVPVTLDETKTRIVAYPAPSDLMFKGELTLPVKLKKGYLLDRRGLNANSAFTSFTFEEYSKMVSAPPMEELLGNIIDKDPFEVIYSCGKVVDYENVVNDLNRLISKESINCECLKH